MIELLDCVGTPKCELNVSVGVNEVGFGHADPAGRQAVPVV